MLLLGEMSTQYPVAGKQHCYHHSMIHNDGNCQGSFTSYATRFVDDSYGFALSWNYWLNDAVSVALDLTAAQLILGYWDVKIPGWIISLTILLILLSANAIHVKVYGELGLYSSFSHSRHSLHASYSPSCTY